MQGKTVKESAVITATVMSPKDVNWAGNVFGGAMMSLIDSTAGSVAVKHSRANAVTASIDRLDFQRARWRHRQAPAAGVAPEPSRRPGRRRALQ